MHTEKQEHVAQLLIEAARLSDVYEVMRSADELRWWFAVDDERLVMIDYDRFTDALVFTTEVIRLDDVPEAKRLRALRQALSYNALWHETDGRMSLLPEDDSLHLMLRLPEGRWEASYICQIVATLIGQSEDWAAGLRDDVPSADAAHETTDDDSFLRV